MWHWSSPYCRLFQTPFYLSSICNRTPFKIKYVPPDDELNDSAIDGQSMAMGNEKSI
jgi:hypothetical protein